MKAGINARDLHRIPLVFRIWKANEETYGSAVTGQRSADYRKQDFLGIEFFKQGAFLQFAEIP